MIERTPKNSEVDSLESADGKTVISIRKRPDLNYQFHIERLLFDNEEEVHYWSQDMLPRPSIFGSVTDAKAEIYSQFSHILNSN